MEEDEQQHKVHKGELKRRLLSSSSSPSSINNLDDGCLMHIFSFLSPIPDRYNTAFVCHRWNYLACHPRLWLRVDRSVKDSSEPGVFPSIETAVSAARPGDTILVAAGGSHRVSNIQIKKPLCLIKSNRRITMVLRFLQSLKLLLPPFTTLLLSTITLTPRLPLSSAPSPFLELLLLPFICDCLPPPPGLFLLLLLLQAQGLPPNLTASLSSSSTFLNARTHQELLSRIRKEAQAGSLPPNVAATEEELYQSYKNAVFQSGDPRADEIVMSNMTVLLDRIFMDVVDPFVFKPLHRAKREPFDYYGQNYIRPLIDFRLVYDGPRKTSDL